MTLHTFHTWCTDGNSNNEMLSFFIIFILFFLSSPILYFHRDANANKAHIHFEWDMLRNMFLAELSDRQINSTISCAYVLGKKWNCVVVQSFLNSFIFKESVWRRHVSPTHTDDFTLNLNRLSKQLWVIRKGSVHMHLIFFLIS